MLTTSSQISNRAIIAYLCLHHSHVMLKSPPELLWESRQTFQNCADLSSALHWCFCSETKMDQGARAFPSSWLQHFAINHSRMKFIATSAPCLWELGGFVQAPGKELCSFSWDQLFNPAVCHQSAQISAVLGNPAC